MNLPKRDKRKEELRKFPIHDNYNQECLEGMVSINSKKAIDKLATGEYLLAPSYVEYDDGNKLYGFGLIHEDDLIKESER